MPLPLSSAIIRKLGAWEQGTKRDNQVTHPTHRIYLTGNDLTSLCEYGFCCVYRSMTPCAKVQCSSVFLALRHNKIFQLISIPPPPPSWATVLKAMTPCTKLCWAILSTYSLVRNYNVTESPCT